MRSPNSSARSPLTRDRLYWIAEWACLHHVLTEVIISSRNIQMNGPLFELCGGHLVVFQVKVLQVTLVRQLVDNVSECVTVWLFAPNRGIFFSLARIPWHLLFQKSSWILPYWWSLSLKFLFGLRRSRRSQVFVINGLITSCFERVLSCSRKGKRFVILIFIFMYVLSMSRICWFSLWHGKDYMLLWVTCTITRFVVGWYVRLVRSNTICPIVEYSAGEENRPKAGHVILCPWGSSSIVVPRFLIWGSENKIGTSLVSSTSPMVEHGGVVGKWTMQLSKQVSVSEFANTKGFVATTKFCLDTTIPCMFLKSFDCWSRSNRSCAAQTQNPVCRMVGKIQRGYRHPSSMSSRAVPSCSLSPRIIRPLTGRPVIRFPGMVSFFNSCFRGWKSGLRMSFFFDFSFLELSLRLHLDGKGESHPSESHHCLLRCAFLLFFLLVHQAKSFSDHFSDFCP